MPAYFKRVWPPIVAVILFIAIWQGAVSLFHIEKWMLPAPSDIAREAATQAERLGMHASATIQLTLIGFAAGTAVGLLIAMVLHLVPFLKSALYPLLILSQNIPNHRARAAPVNLVWIRAVAQADYDHPRLLLPRCSGGHGRLDPY